jgi:hypothetical protein
MKTVIEMAREAGDDEWKILIKHVMKHFPSEFHRFAELVRADEREACAKVVEDAMWFTKLLVAKAIRARGNT